MLMHEKTCLIPIVKYGETLHGRHTALTVVKMDNSEKKLTMIKSSETVSVIRFLTTLNADFFNLNYMSLLSFFMSSLVAKARHCDIL